MQAVVVGLIVVWCSVYAAWSLMPAPLRRALALRLLRLKLPVGLAGVMQRAARPSSGCGGCDSGCTGAPKPITIHRR